MIRKWQTQKEISHSKNRGVRKTKMTQVLIPKTFTSEQLFPNRQPLSYPNLAKNMKTYLRLKQHKNSPPNTKQLEPQRKLCSVKSSCCTPNIIRLCSFIQASVHQNTHDASKFLAAQIDATSQIVKKWSVVIGVWIDWATTYCKEMKSLMSVVTIRKTCPCNIQRFLSSKNENISTGKFCYFSYLCSKHRLWVHVRTALPKQF